MSSPSRSRIFAACAVATALAACSSVPPPPVDRFYRLEPTPVPAASLSLGALRIQALRADSLYAERPIVFTEAGETRLLRQYHYHLWLYAPAQLVEDHLRTSLGSVLDFSGGDGALRVEGRVLRFERQVDAGGSRALAALELRLIGPGDRGLTRTYQADHRAVDTTMTAFVAAMELALGKIYAQWVTDLATDGRR